METHAFTADLSSLSEMMHWIRKNLKDSSFTSAEMRKIELALEESLVNIIHYAYGDKQGPIKLSYQHRLNEFVEWTITDQGIPFNPLIQSIRINKSASLEDREEGGLGISFIHKFMDELHYERNQNENILVLKKFS